MNAANVINNSKKPVIIYGKGAINYPELAEKLAIKANIHVTTTLHAVGIFDEGHPLALKMHGMHGSAYANFALSEADCIINIGGRFDDRTTGCTPKYAPEAFRAYEEGRGGIIHCNIHPSDI